MPSSHEEYVYHRGLMEAEAEILAMLCMKGAGLLDEETARYSRGYVQHWLGGDEFPEASARKVVTYSPRLKPGASRFTTAAYATAPRKVCPTR
jgi:hypothetical protein